jgi:hypothetical protein
MDWEQLRQFEITRISVFKGRTVESLSPEELRALDPWMQRVKECWLKVDREIKFHYVALKNAREAAGLPVTQTPPQPHLPEPGDAPGQSFKIAPAPAPISKWPAHEQSELVSTDVRSADATQNTDGSAGVSSWVLAASEPDKRLAVFRHICEEIRKATTLPEALSIKAQAENMALQSLLSDDRETQRRYAAVRLAAMQKIGELIGELETQPLVHDRAGKFTAIPVVDESEEYRSAIGGQSGQNHMGTGGNSAEAKKTKGAILKEHRISVRTALRYQTLAGSPKPEIRQAVKKASAEYFSDRLQNSKTPKANELLEVVAAASGLPLKPTLTPMQKRAYAFLRWVRKIGKEPDQYIGAGLADYAKPTDEQSIAELRKILAEFEARFKQRFPKPQPEVAS